MKPLFKILSLAMLVLIIVSACKKDSPNTANPLAGNWKLVRTKAGIGPAPTNWTPANGTAIFKSTGAIAGSLFEGYSKYTLTDSISITVTGNGVQELNFFYQIKGDSLNMGNRACIEGCAMQFVKVN
jgi:hypothetical protein